MCVYMIVRMCGSCALFGRALGLRASKLSRAAVCQMRPRPVRSVANVQLGGAKLTNC